MGYSTFLAAFGTPTEQVVVSETDPMPVAPAAYKAEEVVHTGAIVNYQSSTILPWEEGMRWILFQNQSASVGVRYVFTGSGHASIDENSLLLFPKESIKFTPEFFPGLDLQAMADTTDNTVTAPVHIMVGY